MAGHSCPTCQDLLMIHPREQKREPNSAIFSQRILSTTFDDIIHSKSANNCASCKALYIAISLYLPDLWNFDIPAQGDDPHAMDDYHVVMRVGNSILIKGMRSDKRDATFPGITVQGGKRQGCGLCVCLIFQGRPGDPYGSLFEFDIFAPSDQHDGTSGCSMVAPVSTEIAGETSSAQSLDRALQWIKNCDENHSVCRGMRSPSLPLRVLDVGESSSSIIRLVNTQDKSGQYTALSHCWGPRQQFTTTRETLAARETAIGWDSLPKTFQDAITFTRQLNIRFTWIDSLCIIQGDEQDWNEQAPKMPSIYENSYLTIAATRTRASTDGCFSTASTEYRATPFTVKDAEGVDHIMFARRHLPHWLHPGHEYPMLSYSREFPLLERGWVFQERLMSSRVLHFGNHELIFECSQNSACECSFMDPIPPFSQEKPKHAVTLTSNVPRDYYGTADDPYAGRWRSLVEQYSALNFSFDNDRIPALAGLAQQVNRIRNDVYFAGLWKKTMIEDLLWKVAGEPRERPAKRIAPSWSWASVGRSVSYKALESGSWDEDATFVSQITSSCDKLPQNGGSYMNRDIALTITADVISGVLIVYTKDPLEKHHRPEIVAQGDSKSYWFSPDYILEPTTACANPSDTSAPRGGCEVLIPRAETGRYE
ncbi:HET-domain-containing protein [Polyplosphaeria fusca]|uniref:HET-domain-containing protein n=1 Tax=Polyplosphaeria fusca TaxID=682080 RepID=A0A9P4UXB0_9PLEO|nr:HET-domain-containing protein [Polyplosphaeria fusca]